MFRSTSAARHTLDQSVTSVAPRKEKSLGGWFALAGLVIVLGALLLDMYLPHERALPVVLALRMVEDTGLALMSLGLVGVILSFRDWREYFQSRLAEIVVERSFLRRLARPNWPPW